MTGNPLEATYDIPFVIKKQKDCYIIYPENEMEEYFEIKITFRSGVRVIIEIYPQRHARNMLHDMACATEEKRKIFWGYVDVFVQKHYSTLIKVNDNEIHATEWPEEWHNLKIRLTRIIESDETFDTVAINGAVLASGMMLALLNVVTVDDDEVEEYEDGRKSQVLTNRYERNPLNRELCLQANGYVCKICGFDFKKKYGKIGEGFIHVHHIEQLSLTGEHAIDPVHDLIPVCPNCHAMLHTRKPPLLPDELKEIIRENELDEKK